MTLVLCAVMHGVLDEAHASVTPPAASSAVAAVGGDPHGPDVPHGVEDCVADVILRPAGQSLEELPLAATALVVLAALSVAALRPVVGQEVRRRRGARTGRAALVRTSRWRI
ncbi:hypothetical protein [Streptomyces sp. NPDC093568]|uniref:hypothetical protein n=1 Tax=Streptomyces sp. NPDC093568 TaxID=3366041 RepID=UPI0038184492